MKKIAVLGAGSWGLSLARLLALKGLEVSIWDFDPDRVRGLDARRADDIRLPGVIIPKQIRFYTDLQGALAGSELCLMVVPSHGFRQTLEAAKQWLPGVLVSATKGLELDTGKTPSQVAADVVPQVRFVALTGPSIAREVSAGLPCSVVAASKDLELAREIQHLFSFENFRVYRGNDVIGAELGGSLKNVIALAAGMTDGMGLGNNAKAALLTRGLAEMNRLAVALGAEALTLSGLAGVGDLITTCFSPHSRNRTLGQRIGEGQDPDQALSEMIEVAEGVNTARSARRLARSLKVDVPIMGAVDDILAKRKKTHDALRELMDRPLKHEFHGIKEVS